MEGTTIFHFHSFMILFDLHAKLHSYTTVGPRLLRRLGHAKCDAIFEVDAIFEGSNLICQYIFEFLTNL